MSLTILLLILLNVIGSMFKSISPLITIAYLILCGIIGFYLLSRPRRLSFKGVSLLNLFMWILPFMLLVLLWTRDELTQFSFGLIPILLISSLLEEVFWRGHVFIKLSSTNSLIKGSLKVGLLWSLVHVPHYLEYGGKGILLAGQYVVISCLISLIIGHYNTKLNSLLPGIIIHAAMNFAMMTIISPQTDINTEYSHVFIVRLSLAVLLIIWNIIWHFTNKYGRVKDFSQISM